MNKLLGFIFSAGAGFALAYFLFTQTDVGLRNVSPDFYTKKILPDGAHYEGEVNKDGLFDGKGKLTWVNGAYYLGEFEQGYMQGYGEYYFPSGGSYKGDFVKGLEEGYGEIAYSNGASYAGEFKGGVFEGKGKFTYASGEYYEGDFVNNQMEGHGTWVYENDYIYVGEVADDGVFNGKGVLTYENGSEYTGSFLHGDFHGQGVYITSSGKQYSGEFFEGVFEGQGSFSSESYGVLVGEFQNWSANGEGFRKDEEGNQWKGVFVDNQLDGEGEYIGVNGVQYQGTFSDGFYDGEGKLIDADGNVYIGEFRRGSKHGEGELEYKEALDGIKKFKGKWSYGELVGGDENLSIYSPQEIAEHAIYQQQALLDTALEKVGKNNPDKIELYLLGIAGWGREEVFRREINYIENLFNELYSVGEQALFLVNSRRSIEDRPLATVTSIDLAIQHLSETMDKENDILFLYATSHGSKSDGLSLGHSGLSLEDLSPDALKEMLDNSGIKHKVVVISSCYSGVFIDALKSPTTLVLTASSSDKRSFGCDDDSLFTYFGKAFFDESLRDSKSFVDAFHKADQLISSWEEEKERTPSEPQIATAKAIEAQLKKWRSGLAQSSDHNQASE